jgi:hypothetical protein
MGSVGSAMLMIGLAAVVAAAPLATTGRDSVTVVSSPAEPCAGSGFLKFLQKVSARPEGGRAEDYYFINMTYGQKYPAVGSRCVFSWKFAKADDGVLCSFKSTPPRYKLVTASTCR